MNMEQLKAMCSPSLQAMNPHIFDHPNCKFEVGLVDKMELSETNKSRGNADQCREKDLQATCERWLECQGYGRRSSKSLQRHNTCKWFLHFPRAIGNPIVLDLILLDSNAGAYIEIELKVEGGSLSPDQRCIVMRKEGVLVWSFEQFKQAVCLWEQAVKERTYHA